ncbi:MAG TPA: PAS domain S-box protein [Methylophilus sp.]|uniref:PAS domain S-box protein n=1 Tax=Methylophilus sp. TaxID=29541 RepID=UPI002C22CB9E|nr:PAS domain S-box protein [Methylophilus sp.]HSH87161.1 PAS domain S-box protein [Methylophilus sp.]
MNPNSLVGKCTVLILASLGRDAEYCQTLLSSAGIEAQVVHSVNELALAVNDDTGAILLTSESIARIDLNVLIDALNAQPTWSDIPFIYLAPARQISSHTNSVAVRSLLPERISNVMVLERPLSRESLISAVKWALTARLRQYVIRNQLEELSQSAERLRDSNERIDLALSSGTVLGTWVWDVKNDLLTGDERLAKTFGTSPYALKNGVAVDSFVQLVHPEDQDYLNHMISETVKTGGIYRAEYRVKNENGSWRWVEANGNCELDTQGVAVRFPGVLIDIDKRKNAEESLKQSESELRLVTDSLPVLIAFIDMEGRIKFVNNACENWFYKHASELIGCQIESFLVERTNAVSLTHIANALSGEDIHCELTWPHLDGKRREAEVRFLPRVAKSTFIDGFHLFVMDITDRKIAEEISHQSQIVLEEQVAERTLALQTAMDERLKIEDTLRQSQKMESVGQLTGGIAHDFNNLLQGITGSLNVIKKSLQLGKTIDIERYIDNALSASFRAAGLTHRLLAFSRRQPLDPKPVQVNPLIRSMEDLLLRTLGENILFELDLEEHLWETLCDINQLENAILNLAINARDAMPDGGQLKIKTQNLVEKKFASHDDAEFIRISVSDTGTGMTPDVVERAFDPFFTTKPQGQGTGLGLSMIYGFTRQSEGFSKIESATGVGTTLHLYLPKYQVQYSALPVIEEKILLDSVTADGQVILVVEDDEIIRGLVVDALEDIGYKTLQANDGPSGLDILKSKASINLLLTDIGLPGLNGRQIADAALVERAELKVLFMTGYAETAIASSGFLREGMAMITKPFEMESLIIKINDLI